MDSVTSNLIRRLSFETLLVVTAACLMLGLVGCAGTQSDLSTSPGIEGHSNRESAEEAAEVQAVIKSAKPQPSSAARRMLEGLRFEARFVHKTIADAS